MKALCALLACSLVTASIGGALAQGAGPGPGAPPRSGAGQTARDPIATTGHGAIFGPGGRRIEATRRFIEQAQAYYLDRLRSAATPQVDEEFRAIRGRLEQAADTPRLDEVIRQSLLIDWLALQVRPADWPWILAKSHALRDRHLADLTDRGLDLGERDPRFRLPSGIRKLAEDLRILPLAITTENAGAEYIAECRQAGVPIPPTWGTDEWKYEGELTVDFLQISDRVNVYSSESGSPDGICLALPRSSSGGTISALGVICLGRETSKACFWDRGTTAGDAEVPITDFVGGADLFGGNGVCSDCHAGENPFIVHPGTPLDLGGQLKPKAWYEPIIPVGWPENPGPNSLLGQIHLDPAQRPCTDCHKQGLSGRFPEVSNQLPGYCNVVLANAAGRSGPPLPPLAASTMPPANPGDPLYAPQREALEAFCQQNPPGGMEVSNPDVDEDPGYVSPPLLGPLYSCAQGVQVRGVVLNAEVRLFIDGALTASSTALHPDLLALATPPLDVDQVVTALQVVDGTASAPSAPVTVKHWSDDYPAGLPAPEIDPQEIFQCGRVISVRNLPGAEITVYTNGGNPVSFPSPYDWTLVKPAISPFNTGDTYTAQQQLCEDISPMSATETAVAAPGSTPAPVLGPPSTVDGQELVRLTSLLNGALTTVQVPNEGVSSDFTTSVSWYDFNVAQLLGRRLNSADDLAAKSMLCEPGPEVRTHVGSCQEITPPVLRQPLVGDQIVTVLSAIPGARIRIYDQTAAEIGDSAGVAIALSRALVPGDVLTALQSVGECTSQSGFQIAALCTKPGQGC